MYTTKLKIKRIVEDRKGNQTKEVFFMDLPTWRKTQKTNQKAT